jgi:hypothetical protein
LVGLPVAHFAWTWNAAEIEFADFVEGQIERLAVSPVQVCVADAPDDRELRGAAFYTQAMVTRNRHSLGKRKSSGNRYPRLIRSSVLKSLKRWNIKNYGWLIGYEHYWPEFDQNIFRRCRAVVAKVQNHLFVWRFVAVAELADMTVRESQINRRVLTSYKSLFALFVGLSHRTPLERSYDYIRQRGGSDDALKTKRYFFGVGLAVPPFAALPQSVNQSHPWLLRLFATLAMVGGLGIFLLGGIGIYANLDNSIGLTAVGGLLFQAGLALLLWSLC